MNCTYGQLKRIIESSGATDDSILFSIHINECLPEHIVANVFDHGLVVEDVAHFNKIS